MSINECTITVHLSWVYINKSQTIHLFSS